MPRLKVDAKEILPRNKEEYETAEFDAVYKPKHYANKAIEPINYIRSTLTNEEFIGYCLGNVFKYLSRYHDKNGLEDLFKAENYLTWGIQAAKGEMTNNEDAGID